MPRPNVGSAVVNLKCHEKPPVEVMDEELMFKLIKASFAQRRKTLQNGLTNSAELDFTKEEITEAILKMQEILGMHVYSIERQLILRNSSSVRTLELVLLLTLQA